MSMTHEEFATFLRSELRAVVREEVDAALARRWPVRAPQPLPAPFVTQFSDAIEALTMRVDASGRSYATQGDVLKAMAIPPERWQHLAVAVAGELARLGWTRGQRVRPSGAAGPRVVPYYPPGF